MQDQGVSARGPDKESVKGPGTPNRKGTHDEANEVMGMDGDEEVSNRPRIRIS